jgi:hypothetical protein
MTKEISNRMPVLINTPLQRGDRVTLTVFNRFSGFHTGRQTAETVQLDSDTIITPLKRGVNETGRVASQELRAIGLPLDFSA